MLRPVISFHIPTKPPRIEIAESIISKVTDDEPEEEDPIFEPNKDYGKSTFRMKAYLGLMATHIAVVKTPLLAFKYLIGRGNPELTFKTAWRRMVNVTLFNKAPLPTLRHFTRPASHHQDVVTTSPRYAPIKSQLFQAVSVINGPDSFSGHWLTSVAPSHRSGGQVPIDPTEADLVLLYLHGGGYTLYTPAHMSLFLLRLSSHVLARGFSIAIFAVDYSLSPDVAFPTQLRQAAAAYAHLTETLDIPAANLGIMGDSTGANLALSLLSHINTPHPEIPVYGSPRPSWAWLISPVLTTVSPPTPLTGSWARNKYKDTLPFEDISQLGHTGHALAAPEGDARFVDFVRAGEAPRQWGDILPASNYVWAGGNECMLDDIEAWVGEARAQGAKVDLEVKEGMDHDRPVLETMPDQRAWKGKEVREFLETGLGQMVGRDVLRATVGVAEKVVADLEESEKEYE
ncbi:Alpha/Beta hydrolase protein [Geopyxis carbonaria]|nr:Alpha/Beta hydrolase protein [Geopyxis carbonaria]